MAGGRHFHGRAFDLAYRALHRTCCTPTAITCVADIRTVPRSRHNPQFNGDALGGALKPENIEYVPLPALGGLRHARKDSPNTGWRNKSFRGYADYMQTEAFAEGLATLIHMSRQKRTAIMCAEAVPWRCHRSLVADALSVRGIPAVEILSESSYRLHKLTPFARVEGDANLPIRRNNRHYCCKHAVLARGQCAKPCRNCLGYPRVQPLCGRPALRSSRGRAGA